eukprot:TRINITY_DN29846_c0_g1_i1.p1 TRINITY_DN29846_c0_g1~~TRINITY_DN29846_c0_g1_i1.p1  ORF type:complete len:642 (+),score=122.95 TRINITY_DN29846_c0_g1_i1:62-1987(+)
MEPATPSPGPRSPGEGSAPGSTPVRRLSKRNSLVDRFTSEERERAVQLFEQFDVDGNGVIEAHELREALGGDDGDDTVFADRKVNLEEFLTLLAHMEDGKEARYAHARFFQKILGRGRQQCMREGVGAEDLKHALAFVQVDADASDVKKMIAMCNPGCQEASAIAFEAFHHFKCQYERYDGWPPRPADVCLDEDAYREALQLWTDVFEEAHCVLERFHMRKVCEKPERTELARELARTRSRASSAKAKVEAVVLSKSQPRLLQRAVDAAQDNTTLNVGAGVITEPLVLSRDGVTLIGTASPDDDGKAYATVIEVTSPHPAVTIRCRRGELSRFKIINHGTGPAIAVEQGYPNINECDATGVGGGLVVKHHAFPVVADCDFTGSQKGYGACVVESRAVFERCKFARNRDAGLVVEKSANVWVGGCQFTDGKGCGVVIDTLSNCIVRESEICRNTCPGVLVTNGATPTLWRNRVYHNESTGLSVHDHGRGHYEENRFWGNEAGDVEISSSGGCNVSLNDFEGGPLSAIHLTEAGTGHIDRNNIRNYALAGVSIGDRNTSASIVDNTIRRRSADTNASGICVHESAGGKIVDNVLIGWRTHLEGLVGVPLMMRDKGDVVVHGNVARLTEREVYADTVFRNAGQK